MVPTPAYADVLRFLKGPSDEHKCATLLSENGSEVCLKEIYDSIGLDFCWRLLVPLRDPRFMATIESPDEIHKQLLGASVSLSVLSLLTREQSVASDPELPKLLPCIGRIIRSHSLASLCGKVQFSEPVTQSLLEIQRDAIDLLWNLCKQDSDAARIALECRLLSSLAAWLSQNFSSHSSSTLNLVLWLIFLIAHPLSQEHGYICGNTDQIDFSTEMIASEVHAVVDGLAYITNLQCTEVVEAKPQGSPGNEKNSVPKGAGSTDDGLSEPIRRRQLQIYALGVLASVLPVVKKLPESIHDDHDVKYEPILSRHAKWLSRVQCAALVALKSKISAQNVTQVLMALNAVVELHGVSGWILRSSDSSSHCFTDIVLVLSQIVKVNMFSHLQGCSLEVQNGRRWEELPEHLRSSDACFHICAQTFQHLMQFLDLCESVDGADERCSSEHNGSNKSLVLTAVAEGKLPQVISALKDCASFMMEFITLCASGGWSSTGEVPETVKDLAADACTPMETTSISSKGTEPAPGSMTTVSKTAPKDLLLMNMSTLMGLDPEDDDTDSTGWLLNVLHVCCKSVGSFLAMTIDESGCSNLLSVLPKFCKWVFCDQDRPKISQQMTEPVCESLVTPLLPALYSIHVAHNCDPSLVESARQMMQDPAIVVALGFCCKEQSGKLTCNGDIQDSGWRQVLDAPFDIACELYASSLKTSNVDDLAVFLSAVSTFVAPCSSGERISPGVRFVKQVAGCVHKAVATLAPVLSSFWSNVDSGCDGLPLASTEVLIAYSDVILASALALPGDDYSEDLVEQVASAVEGLRIAVEFVLTVVDGEFTPLVRSLVSCGEESSTCWSTSGEHLLLACVREDEDVGNVIDRCSDIWSKLCAFLEGRERMANLITERTWLKQWVVDNEGLLKLTSSLQKHEQCVSLGHSIHLLAFALQDL